MFNFFPEIFDDSIKIPLSGPSAPTITYKVQVPFSGGPSVLTVQVQLCIWISG
jgi:hypothetical protein